MPDVNQNFSRLLRRIFLKVATVFKTIFEKFIRLVGPFFVALALALICGVIYIHFVNSIPFYSDYSTPGGVIHVVMSVYISCCILFNYLGAVFSSPGRAPDAKDLGLTEQEIEQLKREHILHKNGARLIKFCKRCEKPKPERAHHCHVCGSCVLKMDHHCPWIANCVGHNNHHYFILFVFWLWFGCTYASVLGFIPFRQASDTSMPFHGTIPRGGVIFGFVLAFAVTIALSIMLGWQLYLVLSGQTTIEFYYNSNAKTEAKKQGKPWYNIYDFGIAGNFQLFFGTRDSRYLILILLFY
eukprot:TRINITY_DN7991_c0_g1_i1.p1 TRINITY_DN7991_c0_g1~~TRINITY_DN7991_c0_g1_i1.p1  ORF type:complete len:298 (+),score=22.33 TRINITY_DN7991_c0_g1_i1:33-926(+)